MKKQGERIDFTALENLMEDIELLLADEWLRDRLLRYVHRLRVMQEKDFQYGETLEPFNAHLDENDVKAGKWRTSEQVFREIEEGFPFLRERRKSPLFKKEESSSGDGKTI